jgi:hypothetical protein
LRSLAAQQQAAAAEDIAFSDTLHERLPDAAAAQSAHIMIPIFSLNFMIGPLVEI